MGSEMCIRDSSHCFHRKWKTIPTHPNKPTYVNPTRAKQRTNHTRRNDRNQLDYETKVPCGAAYIMWPGRAVSLNNSACQYCTPTKPNNFSTDHAPPRNTTSYRQAATNCSTLHQRRHFTARPLLLRNLRIGVRKQRGFQIIQFEYRTVSAVSARVGVSAHLFDKKPAKETF